MATTKRRPKRTTTAKSSVPRSVIETNAFERILDRLESRLSASTRWFPYGVTKLSLKISATSPASIEIDVEGPNSGVARHAEMLRESGSIGFDTSTSTTTQVGCLQGKFEFACRYLSRKASKNLSAAEAAGLSAAGISIVSIWEDGRPTTPGYFSRSKGKLDGKDAHALARAVGQPDGRPIYFAVDYDADPADVDAPIKEYFEGVVEAFEAAAASSGTSYSVGVYGSGLVCRVIKELASLATFSWLAQSTGWREYGTYTDWQIKQLAPAKVCELEVDGDISAGDYGGWS